MESETPLTEDIHYVCASEPDDVHRYMRMRDHARILERRLREANRLLRRNHEENIRTAAELGGCDHSVGICQCEFNRMNEDTAAHLKECERG